MSTATKSSELFSQASGNAVEVFTLWADTSQRILREMVDLSATSAKEGVRLYAELQSGAIEAMKEGQAYLMRRQAEIQDLPKDPVACYQKGVLESVEGAQKAFRLAEGNAQAMTRSAERLQATAEQASKEIQASFVQFAGKVRDLYSTGR